MTIGQAAAERWSRSTSRDALSGNRLLTAIADTHSIKGVEMLIDLSIWGRRHGIKVVGMSDAMSAMYAEDTAEIISRIVADYDRHAAYIRWKEKAPHRMTGGGSIPAPAGDRLDRPTPREWAYPHACGGGPIIDGSIAAVNGGARTQ